MSVAGLKQGHFLVLGCGGKPCRSLNAFDWTTAARGCKALNAILSVVAKRHYLWLCVIIIIVVATTHNFSVLILVLSTTKEILAAV